MGANTITKHVPELSPKFHTGIDSTEFLHIYAYYYQVITHWTCLRWVDGRRRFNCCHLALALTPPFFPCLSSCNHPFTQHTYLRGHSSGDDAGIRKIQMMKEECDELASKAYIVLMFTWNLEGILATLLTWNYQLLLWRCQSSKTLAKPHTVWPCRAF